MNFDDVAIRHWQWVMVGTPGPWNWSFAPTFGQDVEFDLDNLRAALDWCDAAQRIDLAVKLAAWAGPIWFHTATAAEGLRWLDQAPAVDADLCVTDRLAWRTALAWCLTVTMDRARQRHVIADALTLAPPSHPARAALLYRQAATTNLTDPVAARTVFAEIRELAPDPLSPWPGNCDFHEAISYLFEHRFYEALEAARRAARQPGSIHPSAPALLTAVILHLLGRHDEVTAMQVDLDQLVEQRRHGFFLHDLILRFVRVLEAVGHQRLDDARCALADLLARTHRRYPHIENVWGIALQAAAIVASASSGHAMAIAVFGGTNARQFDHRYEGARVVGAIYLHRSQAALGEDNSREQLEHGRTLSLEQLISLAHRVAERDSSTT